MKKVLCYFLTCFVLFAAQPTTKVGGSAKTKTGGTGTTKVAGLAAAPAGFAEVTHLVYSPNGGSSTTSNIDTTGAKIIIVAVGTYTLWQPSALVDSFSNTWTKLTVTPPDDNRLVFYYCINPIVGSGHNFTPTLAPNPTDYSFIGVLAFSCGTTPTFHSENGAVSVTSQPGAVTPAVNGSLVVSATYRYSSGPSPTCNLGFTYYGVAYSGSIGAGGIGYLVQVTAAAINPTWNTSTQSFATNIADFAP